MGMARYLARVHGRLMGSSAAFLLGDGCRQPFHASAVRRHPQYGQPRTVFVLACEFLICLAEWGLLCLFYRREPRGRLLAVAATMNMTSYLTSLLIK